MNTRLPAGSFFGTTVRRQQLAGVTVLESAYSSGPQVPPHEHAVAFFDLIVGGSCTEVVGRQSRARGPSTLAFHPAGEFHSSRWQGPRARCFHIEVAPSLLDRARQYSPSLDHPIYFPLGVPCLLARRLYDECQCLDDLSPLAIEGLILELLVACSRQASRSADRSAPRWLLAVYELIQAKFSERLTLDSMAEVVGVHPAHLARVFRRFHGCTLGEYVRKLRIEYACRRLAGPDASLADIALAAGFSDQSHFSNTFKRHTGMSPAAFRKSAPSRNSFATGCSQRARSQ